MRWLPVLGMLQEVRGLVQVIMRRTTLFSERSFVRAGPSLAGVKLLCHQLADSCARAYRLPQEGDPPEVSGVLLVTPLEQAIENREAEQVARILESGAQFDPNWTNSRKQTVLHLMACCGKAALCRLVLTLGARFLADRDGNTPLHLACHFGQWDAALLLCSRGAAPGARNNINATPLLLAVLAGHLPPPELLTLLLPQAAPPADGGVTLLHALARLACMQEAERARALEVAGRFGAATTALEGADDDGCTPGMLWLLCAPLELRNSWFSALGLSAEVQLRAESAAEQRGDSFVWRMLLEDSVSDEEKVFYLFFYLLLCFQMCFVFKKLRLLKSVSWEAKLGLHGNTWLMRLCLLPAGPAVRLGGLLLDAHPTLDATAANTHKWTALHLLAARGRSISFLCVYFFYFVFFQATTRCFRWPEGCWRTTRPTPTPRMATGEPACICAGRWGWRACCWFMEASWSCLTMATTTVCTDLFCWARLLSWICCWPV